MNILNTSHSLSFIMSTQCFRHAKVGYENKYFFFPPPLIFSSVNFLLRWFCYIYSSTYYSKPMIFNPYLRCGMLECQQHHRCCHLHRITYFYRKLIISPKLLGLKEKWNYHRIQQVKIYQNTYKKTLAP